MGNSPRFDRTRSCSATLALALLTPGCGGPPDPNSTPVVLDAPAAPGSQAPNLSVGLDGRAYLSWIEPRDGGHALRFAGWTGSDWTSRGTVAEGEDWFVNWADFPSLSSAGDGTLAAHWLARSADQPYAYDIHVSISRDGGRRWGAPLIAHRDGTATEHGFVSWVPTPDGRFELFWLDGRFTGGEHGGPMTLRHATLADDGTRLAASEIDGRVCDCCSTDAVRTDDGTLVVAYRDRSDSEVRDIAVSRRDGSGWSPPRIVHHDRWQIAACPVNGPALAAEGRRIAVAWYTQAGGEPTVQVAFSDDAGETFAAPIRVDLGAPLGRVDLVLLTDGSAVVSWLERGGHEATIELRRVDTAGPGDPLRLTTTSPARASGFPRMARAGDRLLLAWTVAEQPSRIATASLKWPGEPAR